MYKKIRIKLLFLFLVYYSNTNMGISLKCGATKSHFSYRVWDNFRIAMSQACMQYIKNCEENTNSLILTNITYPCNQDTYDLLDYLTFIIKNIESIKNIGIIGIYYLLIISDKGYYTYEKSKDILDTIQLLSPYIDKDINLYTNLFEKSFQEKQNVYIL